VPGDTPISGEPAHIQESGTYYDIDAQYPSATTLKVTAGTQADAAAVTLMKSFVEGEVATFKSDNMLLTMTSENAPPVPGLGVDRKYALSDQVEVRSSPVTVSYIYLFYVDTLGAHPNAYFHTFTFDSTTGASLNIADLFAPGTDYLSVLSEKSRALLYPQIAEAENVSVSEVDGSMIDAGTTPEAANYANFYLDGADLVIVFTPYQVGPWALGTQEARIPRAELSGILKAKYQ
jgi:hypothetical protein